mmetsp:Transcript_2777/g.6581  ORF Transcript_2777/g.6581 Transcript_2777/m.6581 type:complete len:299 (+) Transcript_2777:321-1217(+)
MRSVLARLTFHFSAHAASQVRARNCWTCMRPPCRRWFDPFPEPAVSGVLHCWWLQRVGRHEGVIASSSWGRGQRPYTVCTSKVAAWATRTAFATPRPRQARSWPARWRPRALAGELAPNHSAGKRQPLWPTQDFLLRPSSNRALLREAARSDFPLCPCRRVLRRRRGHCCLFRLKVPVIQECNLVQRQGAHTLGIELLEKVGGALVEAINSASMAPFPERDAIRPIAVKDHESRSNSTEVIICPFLENGQCSRGFVVDFLKGDAPREVGVQSAPSPCHITCEVHFPARGLELRPCAPV